MNNNKKPEWAVAPSGAFEQSWIPITHELHPHGTTPTREESLLFSMLLAFLSVPSEELVCVNEILWFHFYSVCHASSEHFKLSCGSFAKMVAKKSPFHLSFPWSTYSVHGTTSKLCMFPLVHKQRDNAFLVHISLKSIVSMEVCMHVYVEALYSSH